MSYQAIYTVNNLIADLRALGLAPGMTVLVHSSLRAVRGDDLWIAGGPQAVLEALEEVLTAEGTLIMPTHSTDLTDPTYWVNPPIPRDWWPIVQAEMPPYRPDLTPTRMMGAIVETFRKQDGVLRSSHPAHSFAAWGRHATFVTADHALAFGLGRQSPLGRLYDLDGHVLLLGVGHGNNTSLHLSEALADWPGRRIVQEASPMLIDGRRQWTTYEMIDWDASDFEALGLDFEADCAVRRGFVGRAASRLMSQRQLVDYGRDWIERYR